MRVAKLACFLPIVLVVPSLSFISDILGRTVFKSHFNCYQLDAFDFLYLYTMYSFVFFSKKYDGSDTISLRERRLNFWNV